MKHLSVSLILLGLILFCYQGCCFTVPREKSSHDTQTTITFTEKTKESSNQTTTTVQTKFELIPGRKSILPPSVEVDMLPLTARFSPVNDRFDSIVIPVDGVGTIEAAKSLNIAYSTYSIKTLCYYVGDKQHYLVGSKLLGHLDNAQTTLLNVNVDSCQKQSYGTNAYIKISCKKTNSTLQQTYHHIRIDDNQTGVTSLCPDPRTDPYGRYKSQMISYREVGYDEFDAIMTSGHSLRNEDNVLTLNSSISSEVQDMNTP